jgi:ribosomal protein S18 acetylase RimI-like enzyme
MSAGQLHIRQLSEADAAAYRALRLHLLQVSPDAYGSSYEAEIDRPVVHTADRLRAQNDPQMGFTLGAFDPDLVGMVTVLRQQGPQVGHKGSVFAMGVAAAARGRGIGRALLSEAIERARQLEGLEQLLLTVALPNEPARNLYHALGFVTYGIDKRGLKLGAQYWDEELMVLHL